jgi:hypothetical protein
LKLVGNYFFATLDLLKISHDSFLGSPFHYREELPQNIFGTRTFRFSESIVCKCFRIMQSYDEGYGIQLSRKCLTDYFF